MATQDYLNLITSEHSGKPKFVATVGFSVAVSVQVQALVTSMMVEGGIFDLSTPPVGDQLDIIGRWVGVSRNINVPVTGIYFAWDDPSVGWDFGIWRASAAPIAEVIVLPDDVYLTLINARIASNHWDGTTEGAYKIWAIVLQNLNLLIQDNQNMSFIVAIQGGPIDALTQALLTQGYLPLKPEGIRISEYVFAVDANPFFAWDTISPFLNGWDTGSWGIVVVGP